MLPKPLAPTLIPILAVLLAVAAACDGGITSADLLGVWGGQHIALTVTEAGADVEFDCAHGTIDEPLVPDSRGQFRAQGTFVAEKGGPVIEGEEPETHPAQYAGTTNGSRMTLSITLLDSGEPMGTFFLVLGAPPQVFKCLVY